MKHFSVGIIFATLLATVFIACRKGDKGDPGPAGTAMLPYTDGSITGTLTGTSYLTDASFTHNLNLKYFKNPSDNVFSVVDYDGEEDLYIITRYDSIGGSYIKFEFYVEYYDNDQDGVDEPYIYSPYITMSVNKKTSANDVFYFGTSTDYYNPFNVSEIYLSNYSSGGNSNITIDNLSVDSNTGSISFDYDLELGYNQNSTGYSAYMIGSVNVTPYNVSYREGSVK